MEDHLDVGGFDLDRETAPTQLLGGDQRGAGSGEGLIDVRAGVVLHRPSHALDGLLRPMAIAVVSAPEAHPLRDHLVLSSRSSIAVAVGAPAQLRRRSRCTSRFLITP